MTKTYNFIPLEFVRLSADEQQRRADEFYELMRRRRTVREFADEPAPIELIERAIATAGTAPSGANQQPWRFVVVGDPEVKREIRLAAEAEERDNYNRRFPDEWLAALAPLGTDWRKEFLEIAPWLIVVFQIDYGIAVEPDGTERKIKHYYVGESVGIATGMLLAALHNMGLVTLTHTPNPMGFLQRILKRPKNERPYLLIPVGYPAMSVKVPDITKKPLSDIIEVI